MQATPSDTFPFYIALLPANITIASANMTTDQFERRTDLIMLTMAQLTLARSMIPEWRLPCESPYRPPTS